MIRAVLDTNVWVSALIVPVGKPTQIRLYRHILVPLISEEILAEVAKVLRYPRIGKRYGVTDEAAAGYLAELRRICTLIHVRSEVRVVQEDPKDDMIVACAIDGGADYIVTGDPHLLRLKGYKGIRILSPSDFLSALQEQPEE